MLEKRKFPRFRFEADCILLFDGQAHKGKLVNISLGGAMISLNDGAIISQDEECLLKIVTESNETPDELKVAVAYAAFSCIGLRFLSFDENSHSRLYAQIQTLSMNPEKYRVAYP
jgi:hypothetical protein